MSSLDPEAEPPLTAAEAQKFVDERLEDLSAVDTTKPMPWTVPGMVHDGARVLLMGATGAGKSLAALVLALDVASRGDSYDVYWFDAEVGKVRTAKRVATILADRSDEAAEQARRHFHFSQSFDFRDLDDPAILKEWQSLLDDAALVVVDGLAKYLARMDLNENEASHITRFMSYIDLLCSNEQTAVVINDNTGHAGVRSRGSSAKEDQVDTSYTVSGGQDCAETKTGTIKLRNRKHRDGDEAPVLTLEAGNGKYTSIEADTNDAKRLVEVRQILGTTPKSKNAVFALCKDAKVEIRRSVLFALLTQWADDPDSGIYEHPDGGFALDG